jgi:hexosaminidase
VGPVTVNPGGALSVVNSQVSRGIVANAPSFFSVCGSQVAAPSTAPSQGIVVSAAAVPIRIGDPAAGCAANRVAGDVSLTGNTAGLTLGSNIVSGNVTVDNNTVGTDIVKANTIFRALACAGNTPAPTNAGQTNSAGSKSGQCSGL